MKKVDISKMVYLWKSEDEIIYMSPYTPDGKSVNFTSIFTRRIPEFLQGKSFEEIVEYYHGELIGYDCSFIYEQ